MLQMDKNIHISNWRLSRLLPNSLNILLTLWPHTLVL